MKRTELSKGDTSGLGPYYDEDGMTPWISIERLLEAVDECERDLWPTAPTPPKAKADTHGD